MKYNKLTGIILKKQNYKEADQIVTVFTKELGKVRVMAKGLRKSQSKLIGSFQDLTVVEFDTTGRGSLATLTAAKTLKSFNGVKTDLAKTATAFYAVELVLKMTADDQPNLAAYGFLESFLEYLNRTDLDDAQMFLLLDNYSLKLLGALGFSMQYASTEMRVPKAILDLAEQVRTSDFESLPKLNISRPDSKQIHKVVSKFIEYILERDLKSETFLTNI
jgi:DNA repair protein RecO